MIVNLGVKPAVYPDGEKLSDVMAYNHYGTDTIPPRPVLRIAAEKIFEKEELKTHIAAYLQNLSVYEFNNKGDLNEIEIKLLIAIGQQAVAEANRIIDTGAELQHNAPATVRKKGFDQPLYETGLMSKNLGYELS